MALFYIQIGESILCEVYQEKLRRHGIVCSMSKKAVVTIVTAMESWNSAWLSRWRQYWGAIHLARAGALTEILITLKCFITVSGCILLWII